MVSTAFLCRNRKTAPQPWQAIAQRFGSIPIYQTEYIYIARADWSSVLAIFLPFSGCRCTCSFEEGFVISTFFITDGPVIHQLYCGSGQRRINLWHFFNSAVGVLHTLVVALGAGLGIWGAINLLEGYGNDNPGANAHVR